MKINEQFSKKKYNEKHLIYLLLHNLECVEQFRESGLNSTSFETAHQVIIKAVNYAYDTYKSVLTREILEEYKGRFMPEVQSKLHIDIAFTSANSAKTKPENLNFLIAQIKDNYKHKQLSRVVSKTVEQIKAGASMDDVISQHIKELEKLKPVDNSSYGKLYNDFLPCRDFPVRVLPKELQQSLSHYQKKYNCPADFVYNPLLVGVASANGTKVVIEARGLLTDSKLWMKNVASSSGGKSIFSKAVFSYFWEMDDVAKEQYEQAVVHWNKKKIMHDTNMSALRRKGKEIRLSDIKELDPKPVRPEPIFADGTLESMYRIISNTPKGTVLHIDDFYGWYSQLCKFNSATAASNFSSLQKFYDLEFWETVKQSRAKEENSLNIKRHHLCIYGNIQPELIQRTLFNPDLRDSGFIHRFLYCYPDRVPYRKPEKSAYTIPAKHKNAIYDLLDGLKNRSFECNEWGSDYKIISIDKQDDAVKDLHYKYWCVLDEVEKDEQYDLLIRSHIGRHKKQLSKLILNLHLLETYYNKKDIDIIDIETIESAIKLDMYYISNYLKLYDLFLKPEGQKNSVSAFQSGKTNKDKVLEYVKKYPDTEVSKIQGSKRINAKEIKSILKQLEDEGFGKCLIAETGRNKGQIAGFRYSA